MYIAILILFISNIFAQVKLELSEFVEIKKENNSKAFIKIIKEIPSKKPHQCNHTNLISYSVGKFCEDNGYSFYDVGRVTNKTAYGWCYKTAERNSIGILFKDLENKLIVESVNNKINTNFSVDDEIIKVLNQKTNTLYELKAAIVEASNKNAKELQVTLLRNGKEVSISEPMSLRPNANVDVKNNWAIYSECLEASTK